jgi:outer membrane receptor protein involved in Fe transport
VESRLLLIPIVPSLLLSLTIALVAASADDPTEIADPVEVPEITVTAARVPLSTSAAPAAATILTQDLIQKTPHRNGYQVDDLLRYVPDVQPSNLSSRYNHPTAQAVSLRGLGSRRSLVLLDGVPLNDGFGGWINWGLVPDALRRIEVVPGGSSSLYGTWAMGGVIHVLTEQPHEGRSLRAETRAGNLSTYSTSATGQYGTETTGLLVSARWFHTNGYITVPSYQRGAIDRTDDSRHENLHGSFSTALSSYTRLTISGGLFHEDRTFGTPLSVATRTIGTVSAGLQGETRRGDHWETLAFAQWQTFRNFTSQITPSPLVRAGEFRDRIQIIPSNDFGGLSQFTMQLDGRNRLLIGADARTVLAQSEDHLFSSIGSAGRTLAKGKQVGGGLFGEWIADPLDRLTVIPSLRMDWWKNFDGRIEAANGVTTVPRDNVQTALNPKLGLSYRLDDRLRIGASFYQAFRAPTLNELYRGFGFAGFSFLPNENLNPERLIGGDAKLEADLLPNGRLLLRTVGHHDEIKDQILFVSQDRFTARRQNVGRTTTDGGDVTLIAKPADWIGLTIGYAYARSLISSFPQDRSREGKLVPNVSPHQVVMTLTVGTLRTVQMTVMGRYLSRQFADDLNTQPIADFVVMDASIQKQLSDHWRIMLDAENITDRRYIATQTGPIKTLGAPLLIIAGLRAEY